MKREEKEQRKLILQHLHDNMLTFILFHSFGRQVGGPTVWCDGGEGESGWESGGDGTCLPAGAIQAEELHHPASEDELLQAVAGGAVPTWTHQV